MGYCGDAERYNNNISKLFLLLGTWAAAASVTAGAPLLTWWNFNAHLGKIILSFDEPMADVFLGPLQIGSQGSCNLQPHVEVNIPELDLTNCHRTLQLPKFFLSQVPPQIVTSIELTTSSTVLNLNLDAEFFDSLKVR